MATDNDRHVLFEHLFGTLERTADLTGVSSVVEFGVGVNGFATFYKQRFPRVIGVDINDYSSRHPGIEFIVYSEDNPIPLGEGSVDLVVSHSVLEHVRDLDATLAELNRIVRPGGLLYLTVSPLYFSSYGSHLRENGARLDQWQHLDRSSPHYMTQNPLPNASTQGHHLNRLTSSMFLASVGRQPWHIERYETKFERKPLPSYVDETVCSRLDLMTRDFRFVGRKAQDIPWRSEID